MKILIISNSRCGSTNLMKSISSAYGINEVFEPFILGTPFNMEQSMVLKTLINQNTIDFYRKFIPLFDKVILLSRRSTLDMVESLVDLKRRFKEVNYDFDAGLHSIPYKFEYDGDITEDPLYTKVCERKNDIIKLSNEFNIDVDYYEDVFITNKHLNDTDIKLDLKYLDNSLKLRKND